MMGTSQAAQPFPLLHVPWPLAQTSGNPIAIEKVELVAPVVTLAVAKPRAGYI